MKFRIVSVFVTAKLQNIICVPLATGPAPVDLVRLNSEMMKTLRTPNFYHFTPCNILDDLNLQVSKTCHISFNPCNLFFKVSVLLPKL